MSLQIHPALRALGVGVGGLILLVGGSLAAFTGLKSLAQAGAPAPPAPVAASPAVQNSLADQDAARKRVPLLIKQSHGDWTRLSADDQRLLNGVTGGHGREMLRSLAQKQAAPARRPKEQPTRS